MEKFKQLVSKINSINEETSIYPGINKEELLLKLNASGISHNEFVINVLSWANGIEALDAFTNLLDIDSIINIYNVWKTLKEDTADCDDPFYFPETVVPFIDVNGDTQYGIDTSNNSVYLIDMECDISEMICPDSQLMIDAVSKAIETNTFTFNSEYGCFDCNDEKWQVIASEFQINIPE